jgi:hypothetical protein
MTHIEAAKLNEVIGTRIGLIQHAARDLSRNRELKDLERDLANLEKTIAQLREVLAGLPCGQG